MALSNDLVSQFVKTTRPSEKVKSETTLFGTVLENNGAMYVQLDGSDQLTPVVKTADVAQGERVTVLIKDHTAIVTGNLSSPSARTSDVQNLGTQVSGLEGQISEFGIIIADKVDVDRIVAAEGQIEDLIADTVTITAELNAVSADIGDLTAENVEITGRLDAAEASIGNLKADTLTATQIAAIYATIEDLDATNIEVNNIKATYATIAQLEAERAEIDVLMAKKLSAEDADIMYANIDFANITEAAIKKIYAEVGIIDDVVMSDGRVTGSLVGVTIIGDMIKGGTIQTDLLLIKGEDGLYYKLNVEGGATTSEQVSEEDLQNGLSGSIIVAKSITAEKVAVDDLVAFGATIGGFHITSNALYSDVKESIDNGTRGTYMDTDGQVAFGDADNYLRYYKFVDTDGTTKWKLEIAAESILFGDGAKSSMADIKALTEHVRISTYHDPETDDDKPSIELAEGDTDFKQVITNTKTMFMDGSAITTEVNTEGVSTDNVTIKKDLRHGDWVWSQRANGNYGLVWKGADE